MRTYRSILIIFTVLALVGLILAACSGTPTPTATPAPTEVPVQTEAPVVTEAPVATEAPVETEAPEPESLTGELVIALSAESESMDPFFVLQQSGGSIMQALFDTLVDQDYDGSLVPGLAESWEIVDDTAIEMKLRGGVQFHNGEPFNADAVKFTVERMLDEEVNSVLRSNFTSITEVEIVDDLTVRLILSQPDGTIFDRLTGLYILPPGYVSEAGISTVASEPVGTGPYRFVEWVPDDHVTLEANENYWDGSFKGQPTFASITYRPITEASTRIAELTAGGVDIIQDLPPDQIQALQDAGLEVVSGVTPNLTYFFVTADDPDSPFSDVRVRHAVNYAVDVQTIIGSLLLGYGDRIASAIGPSNLGYNAAVEPYPYDPDQARSLLADAGYPDGFDIVMDVCTCDRTDLALAVAGQLGEVGITVEVREIELAQFNDNWIGQAQSPMWRARWGTSPDPNSIELFASCEGFINRYCDDEVTALINAAKATLDQDERADLYSQASQLLHDNPVGIYGWANYQLIGLSSRVSGFQPHVSMAIIPFSATVGE